MPRTQPVTLPLERLVTAATLLGSPQVDACPKREHTCFLQRDIAPVILSGDPVQTECRDCWLHFFLTGQ